MNTCRCGACACETFEPAPPPVRFAARGGYKVTRATVVWVVAAVLLIPYEIWMSARNVEGGPLTHLVKWLYGDRYSPTWWLIGGANTGFLLWMPVHFLLADFNVKPLLLMVAAGLIVGATGLLLTR